MEVNVISWKADCLAFILPFKSPSSAKGDGADTAEEDTFTTFECVPWKAPMYQQGSTSAGSGAH